MKGWRETIEVPKTLEAVAVLVHSTALKMQRIDAYDDRLGSAVKRVWHQTLVILLLIGILAMLVWEKQEVKPEILPYLYVVDTQGDVHWKGVPGTYEISDVAILNHLEDWIKDARERPDDQTFVLLWKAWTRADGMVKKGSECEVVFQKYMTDSDPRQASRRARIEVQILTKGIRARHETDRGYRLSWQEVQISPSGQLMGQTQWEGDFRVAFEAPKTFKEAQQTNRYGILLSECTMKQQAGGF